MFAAGPAIILDKKGGETMLKIYARYICYALSVFASVGFGINFN
jgi:hypothetical protein